MTGSESVFTTAIGRTTGGQVSSIEHTAFFSESRDNLHEVMSAMDVERFVFARETAEEEGRPPVHMAFGPETRWVSKIYQRAGIIAEKVGYGTLGSRIREILGENLKSRRIDVRRVDRIALKRFKFPKSPAEAIERGLVIL